MGEVLNLFKDEFLDLYRNKNFIDGEEVVFGNLSYDFSLFFKNGKYLLKVYDVELDHYGMPYRGDLFIDYLDVSWYWRKE